jgi:hypothetical protein
VSKKWLRHFFEEGDRAEFGPQSTFSKILQRPHRAVVQNSIVHAAEKVIKIYFRLRFCNSHIEWLCKIKL